MQKAWRKQLITASILLGGSLIVWKAFPRMARTTSPRKLKNDLVNAFTKAGYSISSAEYWMIISMLETDFLRSNLYKTANNLWGMKKVKRRPTTQRGSTSSGFGTYPSTKAAIEDILLYQQSFKYPKNFNSLRNLVGHMKRKGYFTEPAFGYYLKAKAAQAKLNEILSTPKGIIV